MSFSAQTKTSGRGDVVRELQLGNNQAALSLAQKLLTQAPKDCSLRTLEAISFAGLHDTPHALGSFHKALANCPKYLPALEGAVQIEYAQQGSAVMSLLERILALAPGDASANAMLAVSLGSKGRCPEALPHYSASQELFPSRPDLLQSYGACLADTGDLRSALRVYGQLMASYPNDTVRYDVALLQWKTHAGTDALTTLAPLLDRSQGTPAFALASKIHEEQGETPQAVALLREAIVQSPADVDNYLDFADVAFRHKSFQVGIDMLNAGLQRVPASAPLFVARGVLEVQISQVDAALADFEQAHRLNPNLSFDVDAIGVLHSQQHENAEALTFLQAQVKHHGDDPLLQYLLAEQLAESDAGKDTTRLAAAIVAANQAAKLDPGYRAAHDLLAVLYLRANQPGLAIQHAEDALAIDPSDQGAIYQEMMARRRSGDSAEVSALTKRFNEARRENEQRQRNTDRYRLQEADH